MVPKLRFKEFNEKWSTATMAEIYSKIRNGFVGTASPFYVSDGVKYLQGKNIKDGFLNENGLIFINNTFHQKQSKTHLKRNDLVMVQSGHVGECAVIDDNFEGANCHAILVLTPKNKLTPSSFFKYYFYSPYGLKNIYTIKTGNTIEHILSSDLKEISIYIPNIDEQNKIADFLSYVDDKITLLNKQYDLLCQYKKGMMQKIFSQELIFKDDKGNNFPKWESKKIGACISEYKYTTSLENEYPVMTSSRSGLVFQKDYYGNNRLTERSNVGFNIIPCNYLTYRSRSDDGLFFFNQNKLNVTGCISIYYPVFKFKDGDDYFYMTMFNYFKNRFRAYAVGSSQLVLSMTDLKKMTFSMPCSEEQVKITELFSAIDKRIDTTKSTLDKLKIWKQGLLQQMFV